MNEKWQKATKAEERVLTLAESFRDVYVSVTKHVTRWGITLTINFLASDRLPTRSEVHAIRQAVGLNKARKAYHKPEDPGSSSWVSYLGQTDYGEADVTVFGACRVVGYREKTIPAQPERVIEARPQEVVAARPERVEQVAVWKCGVMDGEDEEPAATAS